MDLQALRYTSTHEWVHWDGTTATIGITDFAVSQLTDLVYVELPKVGADITAGDPCGEIESVKAVGELNAPLNGKVTEINEDLEENLEWLSESAFEKGWLFKMTPGDPAEIEALLDRAAYEKVCESESH
ncbi:glycine cleavage system protein GcvH [Rubinisphaera sp. JC750]|uniref:glycine cleavage system protein GcvH n=1 Tax=Rubinisphaera sp. JC750 TaxID=2898658 RepID=UPI001F024A40|nr:glycine cleavage system protein GcvH [Rubinisphaera sp. JC750]